MSHTFVCTKSEQEFRQEFARQYGEFKSRTASDDHALLDAVWKACKNAKATAIATNILKYIADYTEGKTDVPPALNQILDDFITPRMVHPRIKPQAANFTTLNNLIRPLTKPGYLASGERGTLTFDPRLGSPIFREVANYWWDVVGQGYFYAYKNKAHDEERRVIRFNQERPCSIDGGSDGRTLYNGETYEQDHKHRVLNTNILVDLLYGAKNKYPRFAVSTTMGITEDVVGPCGMIDPRFEQKVNECGYDVVGININHAIKSISMYFQSINQ